ncbi:uncharacterized protein BT62DRAFT_990503 [Guyanagaster necrorhizus]|uniref:Uncharacterized protein n=1 Tax=Guyanagaster necrorhizus TaxID=856835 RepID=A0A9P7W446_9AGAR|nr:uncharacterized protein BT62DRAFT_990503 [Guyanagaster necrorhizus MCA 3950]KAG7452214.1 hypothetical protein BT62DRAFT_990503 [Guyanagaster necrorhizus MCA 3950]
MGTLEKGGSGDRPFGVSGYLSKIWMDRTERGLMFPVALLSTELVIEWGYWGVEESFVNPFCNRSVSWRMYGNERGRGDGDGDGEDDVCVVDARASRQGESVGARKKGLKLLRARPRCSEEDIKAKMKQATRIEILCIIDSINVGALHIDFGNSKGGCRMCPIYWCVRALYAKLRDRHHMSGDRLSAQKVPLLAREEIEAKRIVAISTVKRHGTKKLPWFVVMHRLSELPAHDARS